ncbi:MAG: glutamine--fructose-6-phosphate transaminase (isomerizing) [Chloroflexi bacterium]|nr:glutamine--fructose-6-phosphate transaminase (isomerizing) [Chloroflexota bacterium]
MCGIIGYAGDKLAVPIILNGLKRLEYRGYDSSGVAVIEPNGELVIRKGEGKLSQLIAVMGNPGQSTLGIGHTRWATHGKPNQENAHPHTDHRGNIAVVHNGIVENYREIKERLQAEGHHFKSQTDSEVIPHLVQSLMDKGDSFEEAVRKAARQFHGAHAIVAINTKEPGRIIGVRIGHAGGLVVGYASGEMYLASDLAAIAPQIKEAAYLHDGEMAVLTRSSARFLKLDGSAIGKDPQPVTHDPVSVAKGPYRHFMLKEIMEQPETLMRALRDRIDFQSSKVALPGFPFKQAQIRAIDRAVLLGMGTSLHSAQIGGRMIERLARIPCEVENASEFRYRDAILGPNTLVISVTQSGETVDTLVAMAEAKTKGALQIAITNVAGSEATRKADYSLLINAGPEIAVASTKTFVGSIACLYLLGLALGEARGILGKDSVRQHIDHLVKLPEQLGEVLQQAPHVESIARDLFKKSNFLILGRGIQFPVAMEGALKLKEVSYIHAEGYQAGEMKHGPIALIDEHMPVLAIAPRDRLYDKMMSNVEEVRAREGCLIALATKGDESIGEKVKNVVFLPETSELLSPLLTVAPLQLLAYYIAVRRGADVDQPRNLAKTVTVE